ncbi:MAG: chitobiase/beta-hexosaminidase C-terminal domain-containing protein, partial [Saprospiraceae bacterium]
MNKILYYLMVAGLWLFAVHLSHAQTLAVNEFMASNGSTIADEFGDFDDWVEIYNFGSQPINIGGLYLSDDLLEPNKWQIPTTNPTLTTIPADGFLIVWFDGEPTQGELHVDAKLSGGGENVIITAANGSTIIDSYTYGEQLTDVSEGRSPDGIGDFAFYFEPTPGAPNGIPNNGPAAAVEASQVAGLYASGLTVALSTPTPTATIYYTTDGTAPTENSSVYSIPLTFSTTTNLRAIATAPAFSASPTSTFSYLIDVSHTFPIISFTS